MFEVEGANSTCADVLDVLAQNPQNVLRVVLPPYTKTGAHHIEVEGANSTCADVLDVLTKCAGVCSTSIHKNWSTAHVLSEPSTSSDHVEFIGLFRVRF